MGTQYHPVLKYLGLMPAKNAAVNFILLSTYWSFMLYRRANKGELALFRQAGAMRWVLVGTLLFTASLAGAWVVRILRLEPTSIALTESARPIFQFHAGAILTQIAVQIAAVVLAFRNRGKLGQVVLLGYTALLAVGVFGASGFVILETANPFLRHLAVSQVLLVLTAMILTTAIDLAIFRGARVVGRIRWGEVGARPQYALVLLAVCVVLTMGLMGYIHSGVRQDWHFYMAVRDVSPKAQNPGLAEVGYIVALITIVYLSLLSFVFWLGTFLAKDGPVPERAATPLLAPPQSDTAPPQPTPAAPEEPAP